MADLVISIQISSCVKDEAKLEGQYLIGLQNSFALKFETEAVEEDENSISSPENNRLSTNKIHTFNAFNKNQIDSPNASILTIDENPLNLYSSYEMKDWYLAAPGVLSLLLHEARRGDRQYRLAVARAVADFPIEALLQNSSQSHTDSDISASGGKVQDRLASLESSIDKNIESSRSTFCTAFLNLIDLSGYQIKFFTPSTDDSLATSTKTEKDDLNADAKKTTPATLTTITNSNKINNARPSSLFGSRYGSDIKPNLPKKRFHFQSERKPSQDANASSSAKRESTNNSDRFGYQGENDVNIDLPIENDLIFEKIETGLKVDPAFRFKILECILRTTENVLLCNEKMFLFHLDRHVLFADLRIPLVRWAKGIYFAYDAWSLKKISLNLIGVVLNSFHKNLNGSESEKKLILTVSLHLVSSGVAEVTSFQTRAAAFELLGTILQSAEFRQLLRNKNLIAIIEEIFRLFSSDEKKSEVVEKATKALKYWKMIQLEGLE